MAEPDSAITQKASTEGLKAAEAPVEKLQQEKASKEKVNCFFFFFFMYQETNNAYFPSNDITCSATSKGNNFHDQ